MEPQKYIYSVQTFISKKKKTVANVKKKLLVKINSLLDQHKILTYSGGGLEDDLTVVFSFIHNTLDFTCLHKSSRKTGRHFDFTFNSPMLFDNFGITLRSIWH